MEIKITELAIFLIVIATLVYFGKQNDMPWFSIHGNNILSILIKKVPSARNRRNHDDD